MNVTQPSENKHDEETLDHFSNKHLTNAIDKAFESGNGVQMRSSLDNLPLFTALRVYWRISLICFCGAFCGALDGYQIALTASIVSNKGFIRQMSHGAAKIDPTHVAVWGGMVSTGQLIGVMSLSFVTDRLGRKIAMHIIWITIAVSVAVESSATNWVAWLFAKLLAGAGLGMMQSTYPLYIVEQSPTQIRGFLTTAYMFWYVLAQIFSPLVLRQLAISDPYNWKVAVYTQWGMIGVLLIINIFLPESPWWLVQRERYDKAEQVLASTHKGVPGYQVKEELNILVATVEHERLLNSSQKRFDIVQVFQGINGWRLLIAFWPKAMQQLAGQSVTNNYATYFFQLAGNASPFTVTIILAACQLAGNVMGALVSDRFGRRWLTLSLFGSASIAILGIGILGSFDYTSPQLGGLLVFFACVSNFGVIGGAGIGYSYVAEIPTQRLRARTSAVALSGSFCLGLTFNYTVPLMLKVWSLRTGYFFGATGILSTVVGFFILPEIARRTPAEIDEMFEGKVRPRKFSKHITQVQTYLTEKENMEQGTVQDKLASA